MPIAYHCILPREAGALTRPDKSGQACLCESDASEDKGGAEEARGRVTMQKGLGSLKAQSKPTGGGCQT